MSRYQKTMTAIIGAVLATLPLVWDLKVQLEEAMTLVVVWATAFGVYTVPNTPPNGEPADPEMSEQDPVPAKPKKPVKKAAKKQGGYGDPLYLLVVVILVLVVLKLAGVF